EIDDGIHFDRHVVAGDHVLGRYVERHRAQIHAHRALDHGDDQHKPRPTRSHQPPEAEHYDPLILVDDVDRHPQEDECQHGEPTEEPEKHHDLPRGATISRNPSIETTSISFPSSSAPPPESSASQSSPMTATLPRGSRRLRTVPTAPIIASRPA